MTQTVTPDSVLFRRLRRERHSFVLLALLLFSLQWIVPVAATASGSVEICYGNGEPEGGAKIHPGHCPGAAGCASLTGGGLPVAGAFSHDHPCLPVSGKPECPSSGLSGSAGLNPFDAFGRGPPPHS
ncbi:MAG: hypothetical protein RIC36_07580 [Rhodospirillales bacterium]